MTFQVNINGCTKVTDGGVCVLAGSKRVNTIQAMATMVSHVRDLATTTGCPLLHNPNSECWWTGRLADKLADWRKGGKVGRQDGKRVS